MAWNLDDYETVEARLEKFWADHPEGRIDTDLVYRENGQFIVKAFVSCGAGPTSPFASGYAHEHVTDKGVNQTSALENCETSAIGRALANLGYAAKGKRPSREEMAKVNRSQNGETSSRPVTPDDRLEDGSFPKQCPDCGSDVWDNVASNDAREAEGKKRTPEYKCKRCDWLSWEQDAFRPGGSVDDLITSLGDVVEVVPPAPFSQWDHLLDMCKIFKGWSGAKQVEMAAAMCDTLGFPPQELKAKQPEKVFLKLSEAYYKDSPDEAPF